MTINQIPPPLWIDRLLGCRVHCAVEKEGRKVHFYGESAWDYTNGTLIIVHEQLGMVRLRPTEILTIGLAEVDA